MTHDEKKELLSALLQGAQLTNVQINLVVESGAKVVFQEVKSETPAEQPKLSDEQMSKVIEKIQTNFWGQSSWAVLYCVCRDNLGMPDNMTKFEQYIHKLTASMELEFPCPTGTIQRTLSNNAYMRFPIDKWKEKESNVMPRVYTLVEKIKSELDVVTESF